MLEPTPIFVPAQRVSLKNSRDITERMVQDFVEKYPAQLGLGEVSLRQRERKQFRAGILDFLFEDEENERRYEVEIQLGETDPSHIIRTLEYWDIERKRSPKFKHCAVLVAEDITSRFLNVIGLFNGVIPFVAIQMSAFRNETGSLSLAFTTVLNEMETGEDDFEAFSPKATTADWEAKSSPESMSIVDSVFEVIRRIEPRSSLNVTRAYVGISLAGKPTNFVLFKPRRKSVRMELFLRFSDEMTKRIEGFGFDRQTYNSNFGYYPISLTVEDLKSRKEPLAELISLALKERMHTYLD